MINLVIIIILNINQNILDVIWKYFFISLKFQSIILILYKKVINSKITNLKFRKQLSKELVSDYLTIKPKKEKYFKDCKLFKINERKRCVFHNNRNDKKHPIFVKLVG